MGDPAGELRVKRIYDPPDPSDGCRVLVDRLWPRGMTQDRADVDHWLAAVAPSHGLRKRWHAEPARVDEFTAEYRAELDANPAVEQLQDLRAEHEVVTLLYAAKDRTSNHALVLRRYLEDLTAPGGSSVTGRPTTDG